LAGEEIPLVCRIVAAADVFDALVSPRPYKKAWTAEAAIALIESAANAHFDPKVALAIAALYRRGALDGLLAHC
jgi:putative two-component system response regulator